MSRSTDALCRAALRLMIDSEADTPVWRRDDLLVAGVSDSTQSAMLRRDLLVRLRHGIYVASPLLEQADSRARHRIDLAAAMAACSEPVWAAGPSAALLRRMPMPVDVPTRLHLLRAGRQDLRSLTEASRHRLVIPATSTLSLRDAEAHAGPDVEGIPCVDWSSAAVTSGIHVPHEWRVALFDSALWDGRTTVDELAATVERWRHLGGSRELLEALALARPGAQTVLETLSRLALMAEGLPEPELQVEFRDDQGLIGRVDMWWPGLRVIGEADGLLKYGSADDVVAEKIREDRLRALGFIVVRWTWREILTSPATVARRLRAAARLAA
jgi:hypothetical protein